MTNKTSITAGGWRLFRLHLAEIADPDLDDLETDSFLEALARGERDTNITRLFFTSLTDEELGIAQAMVENEKAARAKDRAYLARIGRRA